MAQGRDPSVEKQAVEQAGPDYESTSAPQNRDSAASHKGVVGAGSAFRPVAMAVMVDAEHQILSLVSRNSVSVRSRRWRAARYSSVASAYTASMSAGDRRPSAICWRNSAN